MMVSRLDAHPVALAIWMSFICVQAVAESAPLQTALDRGVQAAVRAEYLTALGIFQIHAAQGEASAQYNLGLLYLHGLGVPANALQAQYWFKQSAAQGYPQAKLALERLP